MISRFSSLPPIISSMVAERQAASAPSKASHCGCDGDQGLHRELIDIRDTEKLK